MEEELAACAIQAWYSCFKRHTMKTCSILLSKEFVNDFLLTDGIVIPEMDEFAELQQIEAKRHELGRFVFIKLNWSSPQDAQWMTGSLKCVTLEDILLLLKSSDFVAHDLTHAPTHDMYLSLRKWKSIQSSMEFRCFVKDKSLIGISQRKCRESYSFLKDMKSTLQIAIESFYEREIKDQFALSSFVFDIYFQENKRIILLDFNVFHPTTDSLLFSWDELLEISDTCEFRIVQGTQQPSIMASEFSQYKVPMDFEANTHELMEFLDAR